MRRYRFKGKSAHLLWWAGGVFCYGVGTALEGAVTLFGNSVALNKAWYVAGAVLGGYAHNCRRDEESLFVDLGPFVEYSFKTQLVVEDRENVRVLQFSDGCKVTRRIQTHRKHLRGKAPVEDYLRRAWEL